MLKDIITESTWCQGAHARDSQGSAVSPLSVGATQFDLYGGLVYLYPDPQERQISLEKLKAMLAVRFRYRGPMHVWNDKATYEQMEQLLILCGA